MGEQRKYKNEIIWSEHENVSASWSVDGLLHNVIKHYYFIGQVLKKDKLDFLLYKCLKYQDRPNNDKTKHIGVSSTLLQKSVNYTVGYQEYTGHHSLSPKLTLTVLIRIQAETNEILMWCDCRFHVPLLIESSEMVTWDDTVLSRKEKINHFHFRSCVFVLHFWNRTCF